MYKLSDTKDYYLIETLEDINYCQSILKNCEIIAFDTETDGVNVRKNKIIGYSFSTKVGDGYYFPLYFWDGEKLSPCPLLSHAKDLLQTIKTKKTIMHNGAFDTKITFNNFDIDLLENLHSDTMLMRHTINEEGPFALKDIAVELQEFIGIDSSEVANQEQLELEQSVLANGGVWKKTEKDIYKGDMKIIAKYACADTDLTIRLFYYFETQLAEQNLLDFFYVDEVMPLYKYVTVMMEFEGVYLDMPKLIAYNDEILSEIKNTKQFVISKIMSSSFSEALLEKLCEDYPISNKGSYAQTLCEFANLNLPKGSNGKYSLTKKSIEALEESVYKQFLLTGDVNLISIEDHKTISRMLLKKDEPDLINISSKQQLSILAFDVMGLEPLSKTDKGSPQFNEDFLETIKEDWAKELRVYNKLVKIQGSYYQRFLDQQENGIFYPTFKQFGTTSGRYGSDMQQLSRPMEEGSDDPRVIKYTNTLRKLFIPKPGYAFIDDDYESLEPRTFADDALDQPLIEIFEKGEDFYSKVAIQAENLKGLSADKKHPDFLKNKFPQVRQNAKAYALGIRYGMKAFKLAYSLNIDPVEAEKIIEGYFKAFPNLKKKMDQYINEAKTKGTVTSKYGRVRHLPRAKAIYEKYGDDILDHSKLVTLSKKYYKPVAYLKELRKEFNNLLNNALNFPIQSAAASIVNRAMIAMTYKFREKGLDAWVSLQIHDQIVVTCHESCIDEVKAIVQDCMENTNKLAMKLVAKPEVAYNLADGH